MSPCFNQLLPAFHAHDAIGDETRCLHRLAREQGWEPHIFALEADPQVAHWTTPLERFPRCDEPGAVNLLHYALPSPLTPMLLGARGRKILLYHNITPGHWFAEEHPELVHLARAGREELRHAAPRVDLGLADSEFNRRELQEAGAARTAVLPIAVDWSRYEQQSRPVLQRMFHDDFTNILFVGRVSPNKRHEEIIRIYACYKRFVRERSRLFLVGKWRGFPRYYHRLQQLLTRHKIGDVFFTGPVEQDELVTYYSLAHVFLSMSAHEGFCVPLLEAMHFDLPILAHDAAAVPHTLAGAGILLRHNADPLTIAELIHEILTNHPLRERILQRQRQTLQQYRTPAIAARFRSILQQFA
jgi:glycosyltransferase involved in cell wall biosynthesis